MTSFLMHLLILTFEINAKESQLTYKVGKSTAQQNLVILNISG